MKKIIAIVPMLVLIIGCASGPKTTEFQPDKVVGRSDGLSARPDWVTETVSVVESGDKLNIIGVVEVPGDSRPQAAFKGSDLAAKGHLAEKIEQQLTKIVQHSESGFSMEDQSLQSLIKQVSNVSFRGIDIKNRYWEKVIRTKSSGEEEMVLKAFSLLAVPKPDVKKMIVEATQKTRAASQAMRTNVAKVIEDTWNTEEMFAQ